MAQGQYGSAIPLATLGTWNVYSRAEAIADHYWPVLFLPLLADSAWTWSRVGRSHSFHRSRFHDNLVGVFNVGKFPRVRFSGSGVRMVSLCQAKESFSHLCRMENRFWKRARLWQYWTKTFDQPSTIFFYSEQQEFPQIISEMAKAT